MFTAFEEMEQFSVDMLKAFSKLLIFYLTSLPFFPCAVNSADGIYFSLRESIFGKCKFR